MNQKQINRLALGYIAYCMQEEMQCADSAAETIADHLEDSLQGLAGLREWLPGLSDDDMRAIIGACHRMLGWKDGSID